MLHSVRSLVTWLSTTLHRVRAAVRDPRGLPHRRWVPWLGDRPRAEAALGVTLLAVLLILGLLVWPVDPPALGHLRDSRIGQLLLGTRSFTCRTVARTPSVSGLVVYDAGSVDPGWWPAVANWNRDVFLLDLGAACIRRITGTPGWDTQGDLSPDGQQIVFGAGDIYARRIDGTHEVQLTRTPVEEMSPRWSPDGRQIVYVARNRWSGDSDIMVMNADGTAQRALTATDQEDFRPDWSPDGTRVVFASGTSTGQSTDETDLFIMQVHGTNTVQLTYLARQATDPAWSPDGTRIAFASTHTGDWDIYLINPDGAGLVNLTNDPRYQRSPVWSPDGQALAFFHAEDGWNGTEVINGDGTGRTRWPSLPGGEMVSAWGAD
jgi:TolB protein